MAVALTPKDQSIRVLYYSLCDVLHARLAYWKDVTKSDKSSDCDALKEITRMFWIIVSLLIAIATAPHCAANLAFDNAPFPAGSRQESRYSQGDFHLLGEFSHTGGSNSGRPINGSGGFISLLSGGRVEVIHSVGPFFKFDTDTGEQIPIDPAKIPFNAISVDLAEYSTVFPIAADVTFFGHTVSGQEIQHTFTIDGKIESLGGSNDFESFTFPANFRNLLSLTTHTPQAGNPNLRPFAFDNLLVVSIPEPTALALLCLGSICLLRRR